MKVLMLNGSSREKGCTYTALSEIAKTLEQEGIESEIFFIGNAPLRDCTACDQCADGKCIFEDDAVNEFREKAEGADGFVFGSPVYYAHPSGRILSFLDRAFYANGGKNVFSFKPGAAVASARRGGTTASLDALNKYFGISQMPQIGSSYWNMVHGNKPEDVLQDKEGLQTMRNIALNMAWVMKSIEAGKKAGLEMPKTDKSEVTSFIR
jgi:multimeric flavodoxin WrbA